jgi:hypothetical protein
MRPHPVSQTVMDRADLQINRFQGTERTLYMDEQFVTADAIGAVHPIRGN